MKQIDVKKDDIVELESQFILRIPEEPARVLHEAIQSGSNSLKERLLIKLESDLRYGEVRFDHWLMHAKIVDLPTIIESLKTIDNKSFYKTADICQMMICKYEPDLPSADEESPNKAKKKDSNKVDKKFLWPHGVTPPCKNIRKRRFRKTLKKKYVEAPEIEKEVKRLLRVDNEAVNVKFEIINEDIEQGKNANNSNENQNDTMNDQSKEKSDKSQDKFNKQDSVAESENDIEVSNTMPLTSGVGEHDIFGGEVSSSDDDEQQNVDIEETSRLSQDDSRLSDLSENAARNATAGGSSNVDKMITEFNKSMFSPKSSQKTDQNLTGKSGQDQSGQFYGQQQQQQQQQEQSQQQPDRNRDSDDDFEEPQMSREQINIRIMELRRQIDDLKTQHTQKSQEISSIQNPTLKQRMQETKDNLLSQIVDKEMEIQDLENMLKKDVS